MLCFHVYSARCHVHLVTINARTREEALRRAEPYAMIFGGGVVVEEI